MFQIRFHLSGLLQRLTRMAVFTGAATAIATGHAETQLLWGDTHLHTSYSFDAFLNGNQSVDPDTAYRYARGLPVINPYSRARVQINTPLDFLVVSDHAEFYGGIRDIYNEGIQDEDPNPIERLAYWYGERQIRNAIDEGNGPGFFVDLLPQDEDPALAASNWSAATAERTPPGAEVSARNAWQRMRTMADTHNAAEDFSAIIGWEWSSVPGGANLHRVVLTDASGEQAAAFMPYSSTTSPYPEDLWRWMAKTSAEAGVRMLAIPHNPNISKGLMFGPQTLRGEPIGADYARLRMQWEPVAEVTQIKGDSETHPALSPDDAFANFEDYPFHIQQNPTRRNVHAPGDFARSGLKMGLAIEARTGVNPYQFGMIGSTDSHTGLAAAEEPNFSGKMARDTVPENKQGSALGDGPTGWSMQAGGLAAVWATENSRTAIVEAFSRREVYATTGTRIALRMFGGFDFTPGDLETSNLARTGYTKGVPMGGELKAGNDNGVPGFLLHAQRDPLSGNLDRIQMIKGWVDGDGKTHERIYDVVAETGRARMANGNFAAVGDTVDRSNGRWTNSIGAATLGAFWQDPDFDPAQAAFYYARVLEIPTPRHSLLDAIALGLEEAPEGPAVIQERAYSSPIWYQP